MREDLLIRALVVQGTGLWAILWGAPRSYVPKPYQWRSQKLCVGGRAERRGARSEAPAPSGVESGKDVPSPAD